MLLYLFPRVLAFSLEDVVGDSACGWSASTILGPRIFFLRLGYLLTSEVDGDRGSGGVTHVGGDPGGSVFTGRAPGSLTASHCLSLRLSMARGGDTEGAARCRN